MNNELVPGVSEDLINYEKIIETSDVAERVKELMKNNMKLPFAKKEKPNRNKEHLEFIYARLKNVYHENENIDFMIKFKQIIDAYER